MTEDQILNEILQFKKNFLDSHIWILDTNIFLLQFSVSVS